MRVVPSLAASLRIQTVVAAVEEAAKNVRLVVTVTAQIRTLHIIRSGEPTAVVATPIIFKRAVL